MSLQFSKIAIIGSGFLGLTLALRLSEKENQIVKKRLQLRIEI